VCGLVHPGAPSAWGNIRSWLVLGQVTMAGAEAPGFPGVEGIAKNGGGMERSIAPDSRTIAGTRCGN